MKMNRYLTVSEEKTLFKTVDGVAGILAQRDGAWMLLLRQTGMRLGSLAGLTVADARHGLATNYLELKDEHAKRGNGYQVFLNKTSKSCLRVLLRNRTEMGYTAEPDMPLVMGRNHKGLSIRSFQSRMRIWVDMSCIAMPASPHWFRHTLAMRIMAQSTANNKLGIVQSALGHHTADATMIYTRPNREDIALAMEEAS